MLQREQMHDFQKSMAEFIYNNKMCAAWCDMGMGKTIMALTAILDLTKDFKSGYTLFVAPKLVAKETWPSEVASWEHTHKIKFTSREQMLEVKTSTDPYFCQARRDATKSAKVLKDYPLDPEAARLYKTSIKFLRLEMRKRLRPKLEQVAFINIDNFTWLVETFGPTWPWDTVVLDEAQMFRNQGAKRFKAYRAVMPYIDRVVQLTGTPAPNGYLGLWSQLYMIDGGKRLGKTYAQYRSRYFMQVEGGFNYVLRSKEMAGLIQEKIKDVVVSMSAEDYMELGPEPIHNFIELELTPKLRKDYKKLEKDFFIEIKNEGITALTQGVVSNKLRQFCNGTIFTDEGKVVHVHSLKYEAMKEVKEANGGNPMIVGYEYTHDRDRLLRMFGKQARTTKTYTIKEWNEGLIEFLVMHPASGGHGLNLQHGGNRLTWFGCPWDLEMFQQLSERIGQVRQTQSGYNRPPIYNHIVIKDTIESRIVRTLAQKAHTQDDLVAAVKFNKES